MERNSNNPTALSQCRSADTAAGYRCPFALGACCMRRASAQGGGVDCQKGEGGHSGRHPSSQFTKLYKPKRRIL